MARGGKEPGGMAAPFVLPLAVRGPLQQGPVWCGRTHGRELVVVPGGLLGCHSNQGRKHGHGQGREIWVFSKLRAKVPQISNSKNCLRKIIVLNIWQRAKSCEVPRVHLHF